MRGRDEEDFVGFVQAASPRLLKAAWFLCGDPHRAEDLVQAAPEKVSEGAAPSGDPGATDEVVAMLRALPLRERQVVVMRYYADLPEAEVAEMLGVSVGTVKSCGSRGLARLRAAQRAREAQGSEEEDCRA